MEMSLSFPCEASLSSCVGILAVEYMWTPQCLSHSLAAHCLLNIAGDALVQTFFFSQCFVHSLPHLLKALYHAGRNGNLYVSEKLQFGRVQSGGCSRRYIA